jgi:outer membrane biosynthesis protein TonB
MRQLAAKIRHTKKLFITSLASLVLGLGVIIAPAASAITIGGPSDCDNNAIISCGAHSTGALLTAYQSSAYVRGVYAYFGISQSDIANLPVTNIAGHVNKDGKVYVDGQSTAVATNAITAGRQNIAGSKQVNYQGAVFYTRPPSVSFQQASLPAFVSIKNGQFQFAIIASCGNAVKAAATSQGQSGIGQAQAVSKPQTKPAPKPSPAPAPTPTPTTPTQAQAQFQAQSQSQNVEVTNTNTNTVNNTQTTTAPTAVPEANTQPSPAVQTETTTSSQPASLVDTGTTGVVAIFAAASIVGAFGFRRFLAHRFNA